MARMGQEVIHTFGELVLDNEQDYEAVVERASSIPSWQEWTTMLGGGLFGFLISLATDFSLDNLWIRYYWFFANILLYALLAWTIFVSMVNTRTNAVLHRLSLRFDILDPTPFNVIGRQSLLLALVFIGGISISFLLSFQPENLGMVQFWFFYVVMIGITVLIFFLNMRPTHRVLTGAKAEELTKIQAAIRQVCREMLGNPHGQDAREYQKLNALFLCEQRLQATRTWPYNTAILRTLFFSVLVPAGTLVARLVVEFVTNQP